MAKTRPDNRASRRSKARKKDTNGKPPKTEPPEVLLAQANILLQTGEPDNALRLAHRALSALQPESEPPTAALLPALSLLGEINVELGDTTAARAYFERAAAVDPDGEMPEELGGGPEKFFWLAQLSEEGGLESVRWYHRGADCLRRQIAEAEAQVATANGSSAKRAEAADALRQHTEERRAKLAQALCGVAEVYMTDLSWDDREAETQCEAAVAEALLVAPDSADVLQTVASVRISQGRRDDARRYLAQSTASWWDLPPDDEAVPEFAARISLARLLMEAEMEEEALRVLERLVQEDDHSVEAWYLGGWCLNLLGGKSARAATLESDVAEEMASQDLQKKSRAWLAECLRLYELLDYEDERLKEHATELVQQLNNVLGPPADVDAGAEDDEDGWEDEDDDDDDNDDDDDDEEMADPS